MPAGVETVMYVRELPWHGIGTRLEEVVDPKGEAVNSKKALEAARLNWHVRQQPVYIENPQGILRPVEGYVANVRSDNASVLGIVSTRYRVVQNREAFEWADALLGNGVRYEAAGELFGGRGVWLVACLTENKKLLEEDLMPYFCLVNSHDGSSSVRVCVTPVRVACHNTLSLAFRKAKRTWAVRHTASIHERLEEARQALGLVNRYLEELNGWAADMARKRISHSEWKEMVNKLIPIPQRRKGNEHARERAFERQRWLQLCIDDDNLERYRFRRWGIRSYSAYAVINAVIDFVQHVWVVPRRYDGQEEFDRMRRGWLERRMNGILDGEELIQRVLQMVG